MPLIHPTSAAHAHLRADLVERISTRILEVIDDMVTDEIDLTVETGSEDTTCDPIVVDIVRSVAETLRIEL